MPGKAKRKRHATGRHKCPGIPGRCRECGESYPVPGKDWNRPRVRCNCCGGVMDRVEPPLAVEYHAKE